MMYMEEIKIEKKEKKKRGELNPLTDAPWEASWHLIMM